MKLTLKQLHRLINAQIIKHRSTKKHTHNNMYFN